MFDIKTIFHHAPDGAGGSPAGGTPAQPQSAPQEPDNGTKSGSHSDASPSAADIAAEIMKAVESRSQRLEGSISKSIADKYGMTADEVTAILAAEKEKRDNALPAEAKKRIDEITKAANDKLIAADITAQALSMGFLDASDAVALIDRANIKVDEKNGVQGVKEALDALAKAKPHLVKAAGAWGARQGSAAGSEPTVRDEIKNQLFGGKK